MKKKEIKKLKQMMDLCLTNDDKKEFLITSSKAFNLNIDFSKASDDEVELSFKQLEEVFNQCLKS